MFWVYAIIRTCSDSIYIGKTLDLSKRWREHKKRMNATRPRYHIHRALKKYGVDSFRFVPLIAFQTEEESLSHEIDLIRFYRDIGYHVYNKTDGGDGISGYRFNEAERFKRRERMLIRWSNPEFRLSMNEKRTGQKRSDEFRQRQRERAIANWQNPDVRRRNIEGIKSAFSRPESKEKRSRIMKDALKRKKIKQQNCFRIRIDEKQPDSQI